eukprot:TRINITY_DN54552_c0_g1_i1.p1 TRINITY_DN54552_c0_g1~~TRINITY_DN54552_c0_g1_i1.p1  ORF type:complete len:592 (+),score=78.93 TRINITY_DN54552_c0_g1_i1:76-1851(+)
MPWSSLKILLVAGITRLSAVNIRSWEQCEVGSPNRCTCFEWFRLPAKSNAVLDHEDVKQGFRGFAKKVHPDKHSPAEKQKWGSIFSFGRSCKEFLSVSENLMSYTSKVIKKFEFADRRGWSTDVLGDLIEELHLELGIDDVQYDPLRPRFSKRNSPAEKMHLYLDDSVSMRGNKLEEAKTLVEAIMPRLERTPTFVHLIGPRSHTRQIFSDEDDFVFDDVSRLWMAPERAVDTCDILFMMDITGSMAGAIQAAREKVVEVATGLSSRFVTLRMGFLGYRDMEDDERFMTFDFTTDPSELRYRLESVRADGGGDTPEDVVGALELVSSFAWRSDQRILVHIADAPAHPPRGGQRAPEDIFRGIVALGIEYTMLLEGDGANSMSDTYSAIYNAWGPRRSMKVMSVHTCSHAVFEQAVLDAAFEATPHARGTFLWQYVYGSITQNHSRDQEVVIVTDGIDNDSDGDFRGTDGFNHMMALLSESGIRHPRITVHCIGNVECTKAKYRELAMASGGDFFMSSDQDGRQKFVTHMLMTHSERVAKESSQKEHYAQLTSGESRFPWFVPAVIERGGSEAQRGYSCEEKNGAQVCRRKR